MKLILACTLACALSTPAAFAASPWDGTWKLDMSKSHMEGSTFTYTKKPNGMWNVSDGPNINFDFGTDGKPYKTLDSDDTTTTRMESDRAWTYTDEFKGKVVRKTHEEVSADGKTLTSHTESYRPDGTTSQSDTVYTRVSGTGGFAGTWKTTSRKSSKPSVLTFSTSGDGTVTWSIPAEKASFVGKPDGKPQPLKGPTYAAGVTLALTRINDHETAYKYAINGKAVGEGRFVLAGDGKSFLDSEWSPGKESEKTTAYYAKQ